MLNISINDVKYPCLMTIGAMVRFKDMTGKDVQEMDTTSILELAQFIYCCVVSACRRAHQDFDMDFETFIDCIDMGQVQEFYKETEGTQKKTVARPQD